MGKGGYATRILQYGNHIKGTQCIAVSLKIDEAARRVTGAFHTLAVERLWMRRYLPSARRETKAGGLALFGSNVLISICNHKRNTSIRSRCRQGFKHPRSTASIHGSHQQTPLGNNRAPWPSKSPRKQQKRGSEAARQLYSMCDAPGVSMAGDT